jgi:hypothetical protein
MAGLGQEKGGDRKGRRQKVPIGCCVNSHKAAARILPQPCRFGACQI